jgi:hypothetical protein
VPCRKSATQALALSHGLLGHPEQCQHVIAPAQLPVPRRWNAKMALVYEREKQKGNRNRATLAVVRKLVAYLMAVDRREIPGNPPAPLMLPLGV